MRFYDRQGYKIDLPLWGALHEQYSYRQVASDTIGPYLVSTVWLGIDHGLGRSEEPVIFETMIFGPDDEDLGPEIDTARYTSERDAVDGHNERVTLVRALFEPIPDGVPTSSPSALPCTGDDTGH